MAKILNIKKYPEKVLKVKCKTVDKIDDEIKEFLSDMFMTMYASGGIGLAAPQVGVSKKIAVIDIGDNPVVLINPEIVSQAGKSCIEEGCLSLPDVSVKVKRASKVTVKALDENGRKIKINADGLFSTAIQHELDHLNGILLIDYANFFKKNVLKNKLKKSKKTKGKII